jgi:hypothetical protein
VALTDIKLRHLKPKAQKFSESDSGGLFIEVTPGGVKSWGLRYRLGEKQERAGLGTYPTWTLAEARAWREACKVLAARGVSPAGEGPGSAWRLTRGPEARGPDPSGCTPGRAGPGAGIPSRLVPPDG